MISVDEINKLKEELEIRDNAVEHFRKEAIRWANIAKEYQKDKTKLEQEIKELARGLINGSIGGCEDDIGYMLQEILTKAEEE